MIYIGFLLMVKEKQKNFGNTLDAHIRKYIYFYLANKRDKVLGN